MANPVMRTKRWKLADQVLTFNLGGFTMRGNGELRLTPAEDRRSGGLPRYTNSENTKPTNKPALRVLAATSFDPSKVHTIAPASATGLRDDYGQRGKGGARMGTTRGNFKRVQMGINYSNFVVDTEWKIYN
jgi:hypothetical protein